MASGINFTGISSGMDTDAIVTALVALEAQPQTNLKNQQTIVNSRVTQLQGISSKLLALKTAADGLRSFSLYQGQPSATSGDTKLLTAAATADAAPGTHTIAITRVAAASVKQQHADTFTSQLGFTYAGAGAYAGAGTVLTGLTDASGTSLGYSTGSTILLKSSKMGVAQPDQTFTVGATSTLDDLRSWVQTSLPGSAVTLGQGGQITIQSAPGDEQAATNISLVGGTRPGGGTPGTIGVATPSAPAASLGSVRVHGTGTVTFTASGVPIDIAVADGDTMDAVAARINAKNGAVGASVVNGALRLAARATGAASDIQITPSTGVTLGTFDTVVAAQDAAGTLNGVAFTSASNTTSTVLRGVTLNLLGGTGATPVTLTVNPSKLDTDAIKQKVKSFVTAYNDVLSTVNAKTSEKTVRDAKTDVDRVKGALFADPGLTGLANQMRTAMMSPVGGLVAGRNIAASVGLTTGPLATTYSAAGVSGQLQLDESKLDAALANGVDAVKTLFMSSGATSDLNGVMQRVSDIAWNATRSGGTIASAVDGGTKSSDYMTKRIADMQKSLDTRQAALRAQFTAMESALSKLKNMGNSLASYTTSSSVR